MSFGGAVKLTGESEYRRALQQITQNLKEVSSQMNVVSSAYSSNDRSVQALTAKAEVLNQKLAEQKNKLETLKSEYVSMSAQYSQQAAKHEALVNTYNAEKQKLDDLGRTLGTTSQEYQNQKVKVEQLANDVRKSTAAQDENAKSMSNMRIQINNAQADCSKTAREIENLAEETDNAGDSAKKAGDGFTVFKGVVANLASSAIKAAISGLKKLGQSLIDVGKQAYYSYSHYEQLVGGVETLFGDSSKQLIEYANNAYKSAGISANDYMEQVTSFSAMLLQGLKGDTEAAVKYADMAVKDMSDNSNKMGTDMSMIQNAYSGLARGIYTTFDNLKLGYGGTAGEVARLINDSGVLGDEIKVVAKTVKDVPFSKIIEAIHVIQQRIGITGTTIAEAEKTIEGSTKSVKASWANLVVAIADENADLKGKMKIFSEQIITMAKNSVPRIKQIVKGFGKTIVSLLRSYVPQVAQTILPVFDKVTAAFKSLFNFVIDNGKTIISIISGIVAAIATFKIASIISEVISVFTSLFAVVKAGTSVMAALNTVMAANPATVVAAAIVGLITVMSTLAAMNDTVSKSEAELQSKIDETYDSVMDNVQAWEDLKKSSQAYIDSEMSKITNYEVLYDELMEIVDANGKVKEGYEERAAFIVDTLNEALGTEIEMNDGVIQKYKDVQKAIDDVMAKKKAQIILDSQENAYSEAINKQSEALKTLNSTEDELAARRKERNDLQEKYDKLVSASAKYIATWYEYESQSALQAIGAERSALERQIDEKDKQTAKLEETYNAQKALLQEYAYNVGLYENNMALAHAGKYDEMSTVTWDYVSDYQKAGEAEKEILEEQIKDVQRHLDLLLEMKEQSGSDLYDSQIKAAEKQLNRYKEDLKKYTGATDDAIDEINKKRDDSKKAGENLIDGLYDGIISPAKHRKIFDSIEALGSRMLGEMRGSLAERSPSKATKEMGQYLLDGLMLGMQKEEGKTLKEVGSFGHSVITTLNSELSRGDYLKTMAFSTSLSRGIQSKDPRIEIDAENHMVAAFKKALAEMKVELDDYEMGQFVDRTVTRLVYD